MQKCNKNSLYRLKKWSLRRYPLTETSCIFLNICYRQQSVYLFQKIIFYDAENEAS